MTLEETIPVDEEGATLLRKPKTIGIRRVVVAAAVSGACNKACPSGKDCSSNPSTFVASRGGPEPVY